MKEVYSLLIRKNRTLLNYILLILFLPISIIFFCIVKLIRPIILVRWHQLMSTRIGHFASNTELYLCEKDFKINTPKKKYIDIFYNAHGPVCNKQLDKMWKRTLVVMPWHIMKSVDYINKIFFGGKDHEIGNNTSGSKDVHNLLGRTKPHIAFTPNEEKYGQILLQNMGIKQNDKFVCLLVRDSAYLDSYHEKKDYSYHSYRDCDVKNFEKVSKYLASKDIFVIRMGAKTKDKINYANDKIIDYATNGMRNEFMDIYLGAKCYFWLTTDCGVDNVAKLFRIPGVYTNSAPIGHINTNVRNFIVLIKHYYDLKKKKKLSINEIKERKLTTVTSQFEFEKNSITLIENSPEEILEAVEEMLQQLSGTWKKNSNYLDYQKKFWEIFPYDYTIHAKEISTKIGSKFLESNKYLFD